MIGKIKQKTRDFLLWSQKYTKTDMIYLAGGGFWLSSGQIISLLSSFLLSLVLANLLPKETFGIFKYVLSIFGILAIPTLSGLNLALERAVARGYEGSALPVLKTKIKWGVLGGIASLIVAFYYYLHGNIQLMVCFLTASAFLPIMDSFDIYSSILAGRRDFKSLTKYSAISQVAALAVMTATLFLTKNVYFIILSYFASWTTLRFIFLKISLRRIELNNKRDPETIPYGKHLSLMGVIGTIAGYFDRFLVFHFFGAAEVAIYSIAIGPPEQVRGFLSNLSSLTFPKFSKRSNKEIRSGMKSKFVRAFILGVLVVGLYIIAAPYLFHLFFPKYGKSIFISQLFALSMLNVSFFPAGTYLRAKKKIKELYLTNLISPIFSMAIMFVFIIWQGLVGLVIARILTRYFGTLFSLFLYHRASSDTNE